MGGLSIRGPSLGWKEEVIFARAPAPSLDWKSYPVLRFGEHPAVTPIVVQRINERSTGAGEEVLPAVLPPNYKAVLDGTERHLPPLPPHPPPLLASLNTPTPPPPAPPPTHHPLPLPP